MQPRGWLKFALITGFGVAAGAALAGRPDKSISPMRITSEAITSSTELPIALATTSTSVTTVFVTTTAARPTTTATATTATVGPTTTSTVPPTTTTSTLAAIDRLSVRVMVANGANAVNLARNERNRMRVLGYAQAKATDSLGARVDTTVVFVRSGFEREGRLIASDLDLPPERVIPMPNGPVTANDSGEDVFVVLGYDWVG